MKKFQLFLLVSLISIILGNFSLGQKKWTGNGGDSLWTTASNWSGNSIPTNSDNVVLDNSYVSGNYTVILNADTSQTIKSLQIGYPGNNNTITLIVSGTTTNILKIKSEGTTALYITDGGVLNNQSENKTRGILLSETSGVFKIDGTGKYIHASSGNIPQLTSGTTSKNYDFSKSSTFELQVAKFDGTPSYGNFIYNVSGTNTAAQNNITIYNELYIFQGEFGVCSNSTDTLSVSGNVYISAGATLKGATTTGTAYINIKGNVSGAGTLKGSDYSLATTNINVEGNITSLISFGTGTNSLTFSGGLTPVNFTPANSSIPTVKNIVIDSGKTVILGANISSALGTIILVKNGGQLECGTYTISGTGAVTISNGAILKIGHDKGINGNITTTGSNLFSSFATYEFNGSSAQVTGKNFPSLVSSLIINNPKGLSLSQNITVNDKLLFINGNLFTDSDTLTLSKQGNLTGETNDRYLIGNLIASKTVSNGSSTLGGIGITLTDVKDDIGDVTVTRVSGSSGIVNISGKAGISRMWKISSANPPSHGVNLTFSWIQDDDNSKDLKRALVYKSEDNGKTWSKVCNPQDISLTRSITVLTNSFSYWTVTDEDSPLPVQLTSFTYSTNNLGVNLKWETATEENIYGFNIEKYKDSVFSKIGFVQGSGTSNSPKYYSYLDTTALNGTFKYRLKLIDNDGSFSYSDTIQATNKVTSLEITKDNDLPVSFKLDNYPNPFNPSTTIQFDIAKTSFVNISIYNVLGQKVATVVNEKMNRGIYQKQFNASNFASGIYIYQLRADNTVISKKMLFLK